MKKIILIVLIAGIIMSCGEKKKVSFIYPETKKVDTIDTYFGVKVADPYRWLEDDNSAETKAWVEAQNKLTFDYLAKIPFRDKIKERLTKIWDYPKMSAPFQEGGKYFMYKNNGLQNQSVLYIMDELESEPKVILDPNTLSQDGTVALSDLAISEDGKYMAYGIARGGSDWNEIMVKDIATGKDIEDHINWVKFSSIAWYKDGFFYSRYDEPKEGTELSSKNKFHKIYYHKIGDAQSADKLFFQNENEPLKTYSVQTLKNCDYAFLYESGSTHGNTLLFKDLTNERNEFISVVNNDKYEFSVIEIVNNNIFVKTNYNSPKYRLIKIDLANLAEENWVDVIPEKENVLESCSFIADKIVAQYMKDAHSKLEIYDVVGKYIKDIELASLCSVNGFYGKKGNNIAFYSTTSYVSPGTIFKYDFEKGTSNVYSKPDIDFNEDDYIVKQEFYKSKDGAEIPMFIVHKKDIVLDGNNPTMLYGYGGFNISLTPSFSARRTVWLENGGVYVVANLRGGGEYGEEWHQAGTKLNKQNVFDDFISAAEYLIANKYTNPAKLAIMGGSNGGLLVGAVTNQRPELFKVALPAVGVMDMLRFHKFTIGWSWAGDYGSSEDSVQFNYIYKYSPIHNIKENVEYPAVLVTTADHDDRVVPAHSFKYIATLQEKYKGENPAMIRIDVMAGHGAGKPTSKVIESYADIWAFTFYNMGIEPKFAE